jgi:DNA-binding NtrC family response regulator
LPERILVVDDEKLIRETLTERLRDEGFEVSAMASAFEALQALEEEEADLVITDLRMPSMDGLEFQRRLRERWPHAAVVFITAFGTVASAVEAMREGAADYLAKPVNTEELIIRARRLIQHKRDVEEIQRLRLDAARHGHFGDLVFRSEAMKEIVERALAVADRDTTVLIEGETGTGKEVLSRAIHAHSRRSSGPFVAVNCSGLNPNLVESELFGHEAGAFTGADRRHKGRLEVAGGGTLLIDEVDDLAPELQVRLLRFLEDRTFERVGSSKTLQGDVRVMCATKKNLQAQVESGAFREDLYYRINTVVINIPPLRKRKEDVGPLAGLFLQELCGSDGSGSDAGLAPETLRALYAYQWPGNVRELRHAIEHAVVFSRCGLLEPRHLPADLQEPPPTSVLELHLGSCEGVSLHEVLKDCERNLVEWALDRSGGNQVKAAELLSIPRTTLRSRLAALRDERPFPAES